MNVSLRVTGYDKSTEALALVHPVPEDIVPEAQSLAHVEPGDDGLGVYPLDHYAAMTLALRIDKPMNADIYDWFLEPA